MHKSIQNKQMSYLGAEDYIKTVGLKCTPDRIKVLETLIIEARPLSIEDIGKIIGGTVNIASIYRILKIFSEKNLVYQTDFRGRKEYFEFQEEHHHHLSCTSCGEREMVNVCPSKNNKSILQQSKKFSLVNSHVLEFFGLCLKCKK